MTEMGPLAALAVVMVLAVALARWRGMPIGWAIVEALGYGVALVLIVYGESWPAPYPVKGLLIAMGAAVSTWALERMSRIRSSHQVTA
jgi:hypothetical protein